MHNVTVSDKPVEPSCIIMELIARKNTIGEAPILPACKRKAGKCLVTYIMYIIIYIYIYRHINQP